MKQLHLGRDNAILQRNLRNDERKFTHYARGAWAETKAAARTAALYSSLFIFTVLPFLGGCKGCDTSGRVGQEVIAGEQIKKDAGPSGDSGGNRPDVQPTNDVSPERDGAKTPDLGSEDAGSPAEDSGTQRDSGDQKDGGVPSEDSGTPAEDNGTPADTGNQRDEGSADTGSPADNGFQNDSGSPADNGFQADNGQADGGQPACEDPILTTVNGLIGEEFGRTPESRGLGDTNEYPIDVAETSAEAHPFADGVDGFLPGQTATRLYRINGEQIPGLADYVIDDFDSGRAYTERQDLWVRAESKWQTASRAVKGRAKNVIYQVKFHDNENGDYGIPVCTSADVNGSWANCEPADSERTSMHKVKIMFSGHPDWIITQMEAPNIQAENQTRVYNGGIVTLSKESVSGIVNVGDMIDAQHGYRIRLDDLMNTGSAIISVLDREGNVLKQTTAPINGTLTIMVGEDRILLHVYKTAQGLEPNSRWADMAILSDQITLRDGQPLERQGDNTANRDAGWKTKLGWKSKEGTAVDHLRTILLYADNATSYMEDGETLEIPAEPTGFRLRFRGVDLDPTSAEDYSNLQITVHRMEDFSFEKDGIGHTIEATPGQFESWLEVTKSDGFFGEGEDAVNRMVVLFGNGRDNNIPLPIPDGLVSPGLILVLNGNRHIFSSASSVNPLGPLTLNFCSDMTGIGPQGIDFSTQVRDAARAAAFCIVLSEVTGDANGLAAETANAMAFAYDVQGRALNRDMGQQYSRDHVLFAGVVPYSLGIDNPAATFDAYDTSIQTYPTGFVTERGSIFESVNSENVVVKTAKRTGRAVWELLSNICKPQLR